MSYIDKLIVTASILLVAISVHAQTISTIAGTGTAGYSGDGGLATAATLYNPSSAAIDAAGNVYIADSGNNRVRIINASGVISTIAGTDTAGFTGDGGPSTAAELNGPNGVATDAAGNVYIADEGNQRVRKINTSGVINTIGGSGTIGYTGDGGPATTAELHNPCGIAIDGSGNIYVTDRNNQRLRKISASGIITTVAGNGTVGFSGDGGPATAAELYYPNGVAIDASGNVYISDYGNSRIRKVITSGIISTYAGNGTAGYSGDGGAATLASINYPTGIAADGAGNLYIADNGNNRIRKVNAGATISTAAGTGTFGDSGDGGPATSAMISAYNVAVGPYFVYISEGTGERVRRFDTGSTVAMTPITGALSVCAGSVTTLADATGGGVWTSSATSIATVGSATGIVTGVTVGSAVISYTVGASFATATVTVNSIPAIMSVATADPCGPGYTLTASGGVTYSWSPATGLSCATCGITTITPETTTYDTVTGTNAEGCSATSGVIVDGNRISGYISLSDTGSIKVWLIQFNPADSSISALDSTMACLSGGMPYYEFIDKPGGNYMVKAELLGGTPGASGYIPTYSLSTPHWDSAATVGHISSADSLHINMVYGTVPAGRGFISGLVVSGAGRGTSGDVPAVNMLVYLESASGNILTYTYTNAMGAYSFGGLANGTYIIYPEAYKYYTTHSSLITLAPAMDTANNINFKQHTTLGTITPYTSTVANMPAAAMQGINIYPNPTTGKLNIQWNNEPTGSFDVIITDVIGREIMKTNIMINSGAGQAQMGLGGLQDGIYLLSLKSDKINYCNKLVKIGG